MENKTPHVDIILPNHNKGNFLKDTIDSIINQTFKNFTIYLIDDFSSDNSISIIKEYNDPRIILIKLKKNKGVSFCRNLGLRLSKSKFISFIDSDDYWDRNKLKNQIEFMEKFKHNFTYTDYIPFVVKNNKKKFKKKIIVKKQFNFEEFIHNTSIGMSSVVLKRSLIKNLKFKKLEICEDYLFKCEILKKQIAYKCSNALMYYCISKNSLQSNKFKNLFWVWTINKKFNNLNLLNNIKSIISISIQSIKKYGLK